MNISDVMVMQYQTKTDPEMDIIRYLPPEIAQLIFLYLSPDDIETVWESIEEWSHLLDNCFWKRMCRCYGYQEKEDDSSSVIYRKYMLESSLRWRAIYKYNQLLESNWRCGSFKQISVVPNNRYLNINYLDEEILVATIISYSSSTSTTDVINLSTGKIFLSLNEHLMIKKIIKHKNLLIFFVTDTLKVWNLDTKSCILTLEIEIPSILAADIRLEIFNNLLAFVNSRDCLHIVNLETKELCFKYSNVTDVSFGDNIILMLSKIDKKIKVLDFNFKLLMSIKYWQDLEIDDIVTNYGYVIIYYKRRAYQNCRKVSVYTVRQDTKSLQEINSINAFYQKICFPNRNTILFWYHQGRGGSTYKLWKFATEKQTIDFVQPSTSIFFLYFPG